MEANQATFAEITAWVLATARLRARTVVPVAGGEALLHEDFPLAHDHNKLLVFAPCDAATLTADADRLLSAAGCSHRMIDVLSADLADTLAPGLLAAGYVRDDGLVMRWAPGPGPYTAGRRGNSTSAAEPVVEIGLEDRMRAGRDSWREDLPDSDPEVWRQLGGRASTATGFATFLAVRSPTGEVAARADLYARAGIAQVEDVHTLPAHRRNGYASQLVASAVQRAIAAGAHTVFLIADNDGWPQQLYRTLGFTDLGMTAEFSIPSTTG